MAKHNDLGKYGEDLATEFLVLKSYEIVARNWRYKRAEIDIIARKEEKLIFVEVKTRSTDIHGKPTEAITFQKQDLVARAAGAYIREVNHDWLIRYDVMSILAFEDGTYDIEHIEDAFF